MQNLKIVHCIKPRLAVKGIWNVYAAFLTSFMFQVLLQLKIAKCSLLITYLWKKYIWQNQKKGDLRNRKYYTIIDLC